MSEREERAINLLLFEVAGHPFGCDAEQAEELTDYRGGDAPELHWFHRELGFREAEVIYRVPTVMKVRTGGGAYRLIIDELQEIATFGWHELRPLPPTVEPFALGKGVWGILPHGGRLVLLVDFRLLLRGQGSPDAPGIG